jgi:hypothetical protein
LGTFCYFQGGNGRFTSFTGSFWPYATSGGIFNQKYPADYPSREIWLSEAEAWLPSDGLKFYTDGSSFEGMVGSGVFAQELDLKASFALWTFSPLVFQAEVYTILACFNYCLRERKTICICSDSLAALLALSSHIVSSRLVLQCWNSLQGNSNVFGDREIRLNNKIGKKPF